MVIVRSAAVLTTAVVLAAGCSTSASDQEPDAVASEPVEAATTAADDDSAGDGEDAAAASGDFSMPISDAFTITGGGVVVTGQVASGAVAVGDGLCVVTGAGTVSVTVLGLEQGANEAETAAAGDIIGAELDGVTLEQVEGGGELTAC